MCAASNADGSEPKSIPCEIVDNMLWRQAYSKRLDDLSDSHVEMRAQLEENNDATRRIEASTGELVRILESWKGAMRVLDLIGKVAKPIGYIATAGAAIWAFLHLGPK